MTLRDLAAHASGLPTFPTDPEWIEQATAEMAAGRDGVDENLDELLAQARAEALETEQEFGYSNMGAALLGQALAAAAGTDYPALLAERLLDPLGLDGASVPLDDDEVSSRHAGGMTAEGDPAEPSTLGAYAPAGGIHATVDDLVTFATAILDGPLADSAARSDTIDVGDGSAIGYFWGVDDDRRPCRRLAQWSDRRIRRHDDHRLHRGHGRDRAVEPGGRRRRHRVDIARAPLSPPGHPMA